MPDILQCVRRHRKNMTQYPILGAGARIHPQIFNSYLSSEFAYVDFHIQKGSSEFSGVP